MRQARWFGAAALGLNAIDQMFSVLACQWSLTIIAVDVVARHGLCAAGSRANLQAAAGRVTALTAASTARGAVTRPLPALAVGGVLVGLAPLARRSWLWAAIGD